MDGQILWCIQQPMALPHRHLEERARIIGPALNCGDGRPPPKRAAHEERPLDPGEMVIDPLGRRQVAKVDGGRRNPPFGFEATARAMVDWLNPVLARDPNAKPRVRWLTGE